MGRWKPDARGRLEQAALDLYGERGFEKTTVAEIAARAGVTERTYFRHFADKREVLFGGSGELRDMLTGAVADAPASTPPLEATADALETISAVFRGNLDRTRRRQAIINANPELREREVIKMAAFATALAETLRQRGVPDPAAALTAEAGIAIFKIAFERWIAAPGEKELPEFIRESLNELKAVTAAA
ncbi:TetR family transcriptional regulator [Actinomadura darangshiensis]|uniref:TetR family transcriptional regulator n=1 Tax=Actinomadura darangshiensis TaxID=705336 RepID=A0A4R5BS90_9ACTN|nr:TetR/AcrR family transcriptional regulator [Actinomadura darangshiensis]TDD87002.1 TetR family transcriptional regulator [Actinomadura darangshiensis]